jgi:hypothetical protein
MARKTMMVVTGRATASAERGIDLREGGEEEKGAP